MAILLAYSEKVKNGTPFESKQKTTMEITVKDKALKAYTENMKREKKYRIDDECWMDWYMKGYRQAEEDLKEQLTALKTKAFNAFLTCEDSDDFERAIDS